MPHCHHSFIAVFYLSTSTFSFNFNKAEISLFPLWSCQYSEHRILLQLTSQDFFNIRLLDPISYSIPDSVVAMGRDVQIIPFRYKLKIHFWSHIAKDHLPLRNASGDIYFIKVQYIVFSNVPSNGIVYIWENMCAQPSRGKSLQSPRTVWKKNQTQTVWGHITIFGLKSQKLNKISEYQPSGAGGTRSPPATPQRLQHLTARLIQNGWQGLEKG